MKKTVRMSQRNTHKRKASGTPVGLLADYTKRSRHQEHQEHPYTQYRKDPPPLTTGVFHLAPGATLTTVPSAIKASKPQFEELWKIGETTVNPTPNPRNPKFNIIRKQGTWGATYRFGGQTSQDLGPVASAPALVRACVEYATNMSEGLRLTGAHVNWYNGGKASLSPHQDTEPADGAGKPIFSFTFLAGGAKPHRNFVITKDKKGTQLVACVPARNGDLIVMSGPRFQSSLFHAVPKPSIATFQKPSDFKHQRRINITVRAWNGAKEVKD